MRETIASSLAERIALSATNPDTWTSTLEHLADAVGATTTGFAYGHREGGGGISLFIRSDPQWEASYGTYYSKINPFQAGIAAVRPGALLRVPYDLCSPEALEHSEFYTDFFSKQHLFYGACMYPLVGRYTASQIAIFRPRRSGPLSISQLQLLSHLMTPLQLALETHRALAVTKCLRAFGGQAAQLSAMGLLLFAPGGRVRWANSSAERVLARLDGLMLRSGHLRALDGQDDRILQRALARCLGSDRSDYRVTGERLVLRRRHSTTRYSLLLRPLSSEASVSDDPPSVGIGFLTDPDVARAHVDQRSLRPLALAPREEQLVALLVNGHTLQQAAREMGVSWHTAREHVKQALRRTGLHGQTALVRLATEVATVTSAPS